MFITRHAVASTTEHHVDRNRLGGWIPDTQLHMVDSWTSQKSILVASLLLAVRPGAPSSVLAPFVAMPGAPPSFGWQVGDTLTKFKLPSIKLEPGRKQRVWSWMCDFLKKNYFGVFNRSFVFQHVCAAPPRCRAATTRRAPGGPSRTGCSSGEEQQRSVYSTQSTC